MASVIEVGYDSIKSESDAQAVDPWSNLKGTEKDILINTPQESRLGESIAKTPVGRSENVLNVTTNNPATTINGTKFTGHALDQMQARGIISPRSVLDVVKNPTQKLPGNTPGTTVFIKGNLKVVTNKSGDIITVIPH